MDIVFLALKGFFAFIFILSILVFIHEYGHYLGCKICKVKVDSFSIGMGKELWGWTDKQGVRWKISALPFGGYLKMFGDENGASGTMDKELRKTITEEDKKVSFYFQNPYKKFLIVFFGPLFNLILAVLLLMIVIYSNGISISKPVIDFVADKSPAFEAGIEINDQIISINGKAVNSFNDVINIITINNTKPLKIEIRRNDINIVKEIQPKNIKTKDMFGNEISTPAIGVASTNITFKDVNIFEAFIEANKLVYKMCKNTLIVLGQMIVGNRGTESIGGPLKIAQYSAQSFSGGILMVIYFMALISANLGLMNLLPIPVLDGGHLIFFLIEIITKRQIPDKIQEKLLQSGFVILIVLMVFATFNDIRGFLK